MSETSLARRERAALCDLALQLGPSAPTLCGEWDARQLVAHLLVRENDLVSAVGIAVPPLARLTERAMAKAARAPYSDMVARLRRPGLPFRFGPVDRVGNTIEYLVHHEDLRRAQPRWEPRELSIDDEDEVWALLRGQGRLVGRQAPGPLTVSRDDRVGDLTVKRGSGGVTVTGRPSELALMLLGRKQLRGLAYDGPPAAVRALQTADLSF